MDGPTGVGVVGVSVEVRGEGGSGGSDLSGGIGRIWVDREGEGEGVEALAEGAAGLGDVGGIENGGDHADAAGAGVEDGLEVVEGDAADGEPGGGREVLSGPTDVIEGNGGATGFGGGGEDGADGDVGGAGVHGALGLVGGMTAEADAQGMGCGVGVQGLEVGGEVGMAGVEEILLSEVGQGGAEAEGDLGVIIEDEMNTVVLAELEEGKGQLGEGGGIEVFGSELDEVGTAQDQLGGQGDGVASMEVGGIDEGVEATLIEGFHKGARRREKVGWGGEEGKVRGLQGHSLSTVHWPAGMGPWRLEG